MFNQYTPTYNTYIFKYKERYCKYIVTEFKQGIDHLGISYYFYLKFECSLNIAFLWLVSIINY